MNKYDTTPMQRAAFKRNLCQALQYFGVFDAEADSEELDFVAYVVEQMVGPLQDFAWDDYTHLAREISREDSIEAGLIANGWLPVLIDEEAEMKEWFGEHEEATADLLGFVGKNYLDECNADEICEWLEDHDEARMDCYRYIIGKHYCSD